MYDLELEDTQTIARLIDPPEAWECPTQIDGKLARRAETVITRPGSVATCIDQLAEWETLCVHEGVVL